VNTFSKKSLEIISTAREEAQQLLQNYIGGEHILLGLLHQKDSAAVDVIKSLGVEPDKLREAVLFIINRPNRIAVRDLGFAPSGRRTMEFAEAEAERLGKQTHGTIPILLGLVLDNSGIASAVLEEHGITIEKVRLGVRQVLNRRDDS